MSSLNFLIDSGCVFIQNASRVLSLAQVCSRRRFFDLQKLKLSKCLSLSKKLHAIREEGRSVHLEDCCGTQQIIIWAKENLSFSTFFQTKFFCFCCLVKPLDSPVLIFRDNCAAAGLLAVFFECFKKKLSLPLMNLDSNSMTFFFKFNLCSL